ncbi:hypothetical protein FEM48_Zijuj06G0187800 [Ziziphus jujuba var. spinosa]|uniref:Uncharacterized protein n=1 Tax=Ziziphus jujuba var. spinosa TaxID=714518 RepID=A0A978VB02_ZIZJJ|nr:hypothetical protein FEM48_Zijuj06G0187800 [Ziziphus jujuba var. spinosa]
MLDVMVDLMRRVFLLRDSYPSYITAVNMMPCGFFGYNSDLELSDVLISSALGQILDEAVELSNEAIKFLCWIFRRFGFDDVLLLVILRKRMLLREMDYHLTGFYHWCVCLYPLSFNPFSLWVGLGVQLCWLIVGFHDTSTPTCSMKNLIYIGYASEPSSAFSVTRKRSTDCKMGVDCQLQQQGRNVFQSHRDAYTPTFDCRYAANVVDQSWGTKKILVLREFPEDTVDTFLLNRGALAACDVAVFVYDSSDVLSRNGATNLLKKVAQHCKDTKSEVPMRYIAADNCSLSFAIQQAGQDTLLPITTEVGDSNDIFYEIVKAGGCPARKSELASHAVMKSVSALKLVSSSLEFEST